LVVKDIIDLAAYRLHIIVEGGDVFLRADRIDAIYSVEMKQVPSSHPTPAGTLSVHVLTFGNHSFDFTMTPAQLELLRNKCAFLDTK